MQKYFRKTNAVSKFSHGFTLIEILVVVGIISVLSTVIFANYRSSTDSLALSSAAQEMALAVRQTQSYGLNVKEVTVGGGVFNSAYGIYFNPSLNPTDYLIYADKNNDQKYTAGTGDCGSATTECVEHFNLRDAVVIESINSSSGCSGIPSSQTMQIIFLRPNPRAVVNFFDNAGTLRCSSQFDGIITLKSPRNTRTTVTVGSTGQITIR